MLYDEEPGLAVKYWWSLLFKNTLHFKFDYLFLSIKIG